MQYWHMNRLADDVRIALRMLRRSPTFAATSILILGLGIGMAVAMWAVVNAVLVRGLPVQDATRIVLPRSLDQAGVDIALTRGEVDQLRRESRTMREVTGVAHFGSSSAWPIMDGDRPLVLRAAQVDGNFFELLGVRPALGRLLRSGNDTASGAMVLSYGAWQRDFGGDSSIIGHPLSEPLLGNHYSVVGIAPPGFDYPAAADYWIFPPFPQRENVVARLAPGASPAAARAEFLAIVTRMDQQRTAPFGVGTADIRTLTTAVVGNVRPVLLVLSAAAALLLIMACVNVGNLLLLRAAMRSRELAVRRALGATYGDIVRQLLLESALLAGGGGIFGLLVAELARRALVSSALPQLPRLDAVRVAGTPVMAAAAIALVSVMIFGLLPALTALHRNSPLAIRLDDRSGGASQQRRRIRHALVATQVALALIMLSGAGLLARTLGRLQSVDLGFQADHLAILQLMLPVSEYGDQAKYFAFVDALFPRLTSIAGVRAVTPVLMPPFHGPNFWTGVWQVDWQSPADAEKNPSLPEEAGGPDYFRTFDIPIVRGRSFLETDREQSPKVVVISESVAHRYWPGQDPIGKRMRFSGDSEPWMTVVGVAGDTHFRSLREAVPMVYRPWRQSVWQGYIAVRTTTSLSAALPVIRRAIGEVDPRVNLWLARTMDDYVGEQLVQPRLSALLLSVFGLVALLLAAIGLYGVMASAVSDQTREIGVRIALGATPDRLRRDVLGRALTVASAGTAVGLACAIATSKLISSLLYQVSPTDPIILVGACATLLAIALLAAYVPARRATRIEPARALRAE
jgi:putative ABC transport system permease protein